MRGLALARYRLLTTIRPAWGIFGTVLAMAAVPMLYGSGLWTATSESWQSMAEDMYVSARMVGITYLLHILFLVAACSAFGTVRPLADGRAAADLTETVPITPRDRFLGDAAGILGCILAVHACTLPLLALVIVLSPLPTTLFFWLESITLAIAVLGSAGASWMLRATSRWMRTRSARAIATFGIVFVVILIFNTRWAQFAEATTWLIVVQPSAGAWRDLKATVTNPPMLMALLLLLYVGYISYFMLQSVRSIERQ